MIAAQGGHVDTVKLLLDRGASVGLGLVGHLAIVSPVSLRTF